MIVNYNLIFYKYTSNTEPNGYVIRYWGNINKLKVRK